MKNNKDAVTNVLYPQYKWDERLGVDREVEIPPQTVFMPIGYDRTKDDGIKHYRRYYPDELENVGEVMQASPFLCEDMFRMK